MKFTSKLSKETLVCEELKVREYKTLLKSVYGVVDPLIYIETISEILATVTNKDKEFFKKLNVVDIFCLLLDLRVNSQGNECKLSLDQEGKQLTVNLNLNLVREDITSLTESLKTTIKIDDNIQINFECPNFERLAVVQSTDFISFVNGISLVKDENCVFYELKTNEEAISVLDRLTSKLLFEIIDKYMKFAEKTSSINFFSRYNIQGEQLTFLPTLEYLIWFTKLIFGESLETLYSNIFHLSISANMNSDYIERCAVGEYIYFVTCLQKIKAAQETQQAINIENQ